MLYRPRGVYDGCKEGMGRHSHQGVERQTGDGSSQHIEGVYVPSPIEPSEETIEFGIISQGNSHHLLELHRAMSVEGIEEKDEKAQN